MRISALIVRGAFFFLFASQVAAATLGAVQTAESPTADGFPWLEPVAASHDLSQELHRLRPPVHSPSVSVVRHPNYCEQIDGTDPNSPSVQYGTSCIRLS